MITGSAADLLCSPTAHARLIKCISNQAVLGGRAHVRTKPHSPQEEGEKRKIVPKRAALSSTRPPL